MGAFSPPPRFLRYLWKALALSAGTTHGGMSRSRFAQHVCFSDLKPATLAETPEVRSMNARDRVTGRRAPRGFFSSGRMPTLGGLLSKFSRGFCPVPGCGVCNGRHLQKGRPLPSGLPIDAWVWVSGAITNPRRRNTAQGHAVNWRSGKTSTSPITLRW